MLGLANGGLKSKSYDNTWDFDASDLTNTKSAVCKLWLKHNTGLTGGDGNPCSLWDDSSGQDNHAVQSESAKRPTIDGGGLEFTAGNSDHMTLTSTITVSAEEGFAIFTVLDIDSFGAVQGIFSQNNNIFIVLNDADTLRVKSSDNNVMNFTPALTADTKLILTIRRESGSLGQFHIYINGEKVHITNAALNSQRNTQSYVLDELGSRNGTSNFFGGHIYEVLLYETGDLQEKEVTGICNYLKTIHSIT